LARGNVGKGNDDFPVADPRDVSDASFVAAKLQELDELLRQAKLFGDDDINSRRHAVENHRGGRGARGERFSPNL
jgi:hypothetical protein